MDAIRRNPLVTALVVGLGGIAAANTIPQFVDETMPWFAVRLAMRGDLVVSVIFGVLLAAVVYLGVEYLRYRDGLKKVIRDYIVEVQDWQHKADPEHYAPGQSDEVKRGEAGATKEHGDRIIGKYGLPPEKEYR